MSRFFSMLSIAAVITLTACSEQPTAPAVEPGVQYAKSGGGGVGSPHFTFDGTACAVDTGTGVTTCNFQIAGLGKNGSALVALDGVLDVSYQCYSLTGVLKDTRSTIRIFIDGTVFANESGNAVGSLSDGPNLPVTALDCLGGFLWHPENVRYELQSNGKNGVPFWPGEWSLSAAAITAKGSGKLFFYTGPMTLLNEPI